jgi:hypothetical protein
LSYSADKYLDAWKAAGGDPTAYYADLPFLNG